MRKVLPGSDKYRTPSPDKPTPWSDPLVERANREVPIVDLLNTYFGTHVPLDADGWKTRCPFAREHDDGGVDRQFRVYAQGNRAFCFALHGSLDPVRLWRLREYFPTMRDAAENLLTAYGIEYRPKPYRERMARLRARETGFQADPDALVQAINVYLSTLPGYEEAQYDDRVLRSVNSLLGEVHALCERAESIEEVKLWFQQAKARLQTHLTNFRE